MELEDKSLEEIFNYFIEIIKRTRKNGYTKKQTIACLIDLHINALNVLEQIGDNEKEQIKIKAMLYDCLKKREETKLKILFSEPEGGKP